MKTCISLLIIFLFSFNPHSFAQLAAFNIEIFIDNGNIFEEDMVVTKDGSLVALFTVEDVNGRSAVMIKWSPGGDLIWQKDITHNNLELYPSIIREYPDGRLGVGIGDFEFLGGFAQSNISWLEFSSDGELLNALRIGNTDAQALTDALILSDEEVIFTVHYGMNGFWGTAFLRLNSATQSISNQSYIKEGDLTYINRLFPLSDERYIGVGSNTAVFGEARNAIAVLFDKDLQPLNSILLDDIGIPSEGTYALELEDGNVQLFLDRNELRTYLILDGNLNVLETKSGIFGEIQEVLVDNNATYYFSGSTGAVEFRGPETFAKVVASNNTAARSVRFSNDDYVWGAGIYFNVDSEYFRTMIKKELIVPDKFCGSYNYNPEEYIDVEVNTSTQAPSTGSFNYQITEDTEDYIIADFQGSVVETCREFEVSTTEPNLADFRFYPNPVEHQLTIEFVEEFRGNLQILNLNGNVVQTHYSVGKDFTLDTSFLPRGMYLLKANDSISRFVKM